MKKILVLILVINCMVLSSCGSKTTIDLTEEKKQTTAEEKEVEQQEEIAEDIKETEEKKEDKKEEFLDNDVEIIMSMISFDESMTIEQYVEEKNAKEPGKNYRVYDEEHYAVTIKESERQEVIENFKNDESIAEAFKEVFQTDEYKDAFLTMEYDDMFSEISFYVDKVKYDEMGIFANLVPVLTSAIVSDYVQAFHLVPVEERKVKVLFIDNETKEVVFDSDETE